VNTKAAIVALVLALLGIGGAYYLLRPEPGVTVQPTWVASLDAARVERIGVSWAGGRSATLEPSPVPALWLLRMGEGVWPVRASRVHAAVKLMAGIDAGAGAEAGRADAAVVGVTVGGVERRFSVSGAALAGRVLVKVEGTPDSYRLVDAQIGRMFEDAGLRAWREPAAFSTEEFSRVRLQTIGRQVVVARVAGRWGGPAPVIAPADQEACAQLARTLIGLRLERIVDEAPGDEKTLGLHNPAAVIDTETDFRVVKDGDVQRTVLVQQLKVGGPVDGTGERLFASVRAQWLDPATRSMTPAWGPVLAVVSRQDLNALTAELPVYLARQTVQAAASDVSRVTVVRDDAAMTDSAPGPLPGRQFVIGRYIDEWQVTPAGQQTARAAGSDEANAIDRLLKVLTEQPADAVGREPPAGSKGFVRLVVEATGAGADIGVATAMVAPAVKKGEVAAEPKPALVLRVGGIYRVYFGADPGAVAVWLEDVLPPEG
jgi:hypothetical protein